MSDFSKLDALLYKTHIKVTHIKDMCRSIILNKIALLVWRDHPFSQRKSSGGGDWRWQRRGVGQNFKKGGRQYVKEGLKFYPSLSLPPTIIQRSFRDHYIFMDHRQILLLILHEFNEIKWNFLFFLKLSENRRVSDDFRGNGR